MRSRRCVGRSLPHRGCRYPVHRPVGWGSRTRGAPLTCIDQRRPGPEHDRRCVAPAAISDLHPASGMVVAAGPHVGIQGRRAARAASRRRRPPPNQPDAAPGLGGQGGARRPHPTTAHSPARSSPGHPRYSPALAPPPGGEEVDLPEPTWAPMCRRHHRHAGRADGHGEPDLGLPVEVSELLSAMLGRIG
jgi:hypothetical protein